MVGSSPPLANYPGLMEAGQEMACDAVRRLRLAAVHGEVQIRERCRLFRDRAAQVFQSSTLLVLAQPAILYV